MGVEWLAKEWTIKTLVGLGLGQTEAQIYVFLTIQGPWKKKEIVDILNLSKTKLHGSLNNLQSKGLINVSPGYLAIFSAVPLDQALISLVEKENKQADNLEKNREAILSYWRNLTSNR